MAFGQASGPPASRKQLEELERLLEAAGFDGFKEARYPLGFSQRQAGGKFTADEATGFIDQLEAGDSSDGSNDEPTTIEKPKPKPKPKPTAKASPRPAKPASDVERALRRVPVEQLAAELQRRGWVVLEP